MALRTKVMEPEDWEQYFIEAGISSSSAKTHAVVFANEKLTIATLQMLDRAMLRELGVTSMGEALCILKQAKEATPQATYMKAPTAKLPQLNLEMTPQQFRKFQIDWEVFVKITKTPESQTNIHLYNSTNQPTVTTQDKPARALSRLLPHNKPGLKELIPPRKTIAHGGRGRYRTSMNSTHLQANSNMAGSLKS